jgi:hypothetical protein
MVGEYNIGMTTQEIQACFWRGMLPFLTSSLITLKIGTYVISQTWQL